MNRRFGILLLVLAAGCARFEPHPLVPKDTAGSLTRRSLADPALKQFLETSLEQKFPQWPRADWDLRLLTWGAYFFSPDLEVARAQWGVSQAGIATAAGRPNPTVNFGPGYNSDAVSGVTPWMPFINFDLPIETAGKRGYRMAEAAGRSQAAALNIQTTAWHVRSRVRVAFLDLGAAGIRQQLLQAQVSTRETILTRLEQRVRAGALAQSELSLSRIALANARLALGDAHRQLAESQAALAEAVGVPLTALQPVNVANDPRTQPAPDGGLASDSLREVALQSRSDILAALAEYAATQSALQLEIAKQYPNLHLSPGFQWDQGESKWQLGIGLELPVLNRNQGPIAEAEARRTETAARFMALQAKVLAEIDRAAAVYTAEKNTVAALESVTAAQRSRLNSVKAEVDAGASDALDLLNAQLEMETAELLSLEARVKLQQALGALEDALQHSFVSPADTVPAAPHP